MSVNACRGLRAAVLLVALSAYRSPLDCQQYSRIDFLHLRDSLAAVSDTVTLRTRFRSARQHEKRNREDSSAVFRSGLLALRLGELGADPDFGDAVSRFREAVRRQPHRPEAWFGLGLSEVGRSAWEMSQRLNLGSRVGIKALERAANNYRRALAAEATYLPAALDLTAVELSLLDTTRLSLARDALRRTVESVHPDPPELLLALGRLERSSGKPDSAVVAFERYLRIGPNRALGLLELARARLALGDPTGEAPYYQGAAMDDPKAVAGYRADLQLLATASEVGEFDRLRGVARAIYLYRFWSGRDRVELREDGERLREHYRRLQYARRNFPLTISRRFYSWIDAYRSGSVELDDRGIIYIRHGEPAQRIRPFIFGAMPNESWRYARAEGDLLLHFSGGWDGNGGGDLYDYRLVQSVLDLRRAPDTPRDQLLLSRQSLSPAYGRMLNWGTYGAARAGAQERSIGRASISVATSSDSYELQFIRTLGAVADLVTVGRRNGGNLGHLVFAIAAPGTSPERTAGEISYPVRVRLVALDARERAVSRLDTTVVIRLSRPLSLREHLVGRVEVLLPAGRWTYRASFEQGDSSGVVLPRDTVQVAPADGSVFSLSDLALGSEGRAARWVTEAADTVLLSPAASFRIGSEVELYYEVGGARAGALYRHEISVLRPERRRSGRRQALVALSFAEEAPGPIIRSHRAVRLERLKPGSYVVELKVTGPDGSSRVRRRTINITAGKSLLPFDGGGRL